MTEPVHKTTASRLWTFRARRGPDDEVIVTLGASGEMVFSEHQAEVLARLLLSCCQGVTEDTGMVRL